MLQKSNWPHFTCIFLLNKISPITLLKSIVSGALEMWAGFPKKHKIAERFLCAILHFFKKLSGIVQYMGEMVLVREVFEKVKRHFWQPCTVDL